MINMNNEIKEHIINLKGLGPKQISVLRQLIEHPGWKIVSIYDSEWYKFRDKRDLAFFQDEDDNETEDNKEIPQQILASLHKRNILTWHIMHKCIDPDIDISTYRLKDLARELLQKKLNKAIY